MENLQAAALVAPVIYPCCHCPRVFTHRNGMKDHKADAHGNILKKGSCSCGRKI